MRRTIFLLLITIFVLQVEAQEFKQRWSQLINKAKTEYAVENYGNALTLFQKAANIIPTDTTAYQYIIDCAFKVHKPALLLKTLEKLKTIHEVTAEDYAYAIASLYSYQKKHRKALKYVKEAKEKFPDNKRILIEEANVYYDYGDYSSAVEKLNHIIEAYPDTRQAYNLLIKIHKEVQQNFEKALTVTRTGIRQFEDNLEFKKQETDILLRLKRIDEARRKLNALVEKNPENPTLYYNLALTHYEAGDYKKSAEICKKAIDLDPNFVEAYYNVGAFYYNYGLSYTEALGNMSLAQYKNQGKDTENKAITYLEKAKPYYQKAIELNPDELDAYKSLNTIDVLLENLRANRAAIHAETDSMKTDSAATDSSALAQQPADTTAVDSTQLAQKKQKADVSETIKKDTNRQIALKDTSQADAKSEDVAKTQQEEEASVSTGPVTTGNNSNEVIMEKDKRVKIEKAQAAPAIVDISFLYPQEKTSLTRGKSGWVKVTIGNQGRQPANAQFVLMEPVISPHLKYQRKNQFNNLQPGQVVSLKVPLHYKKADATTVEIDNLRLKQKKFRAMVRDASGFRSSLVEFTVSLGKGKEKKEVASQVTGLKGNNYLLLLGADTYSSWQNSGKGVDKLIQLKNTLHKDYRFAESYTYTIFDDKLTLFNIRNALIRLQKEIGKADNLIIAYAGKSFYDINKDMAYWVPVKAGRNQPENYLASQTLISYLEDFQAKHIVLFTEGVFPRARIIPDDADNFKADNEALPSRWILCGNQPSDTLVNSPNHTYLQFLNKSLAENTRPELAVSEIVNFVRMIMKDKTARNPVGGPIDMSGNYYGDYVFHRKQQAKKEDK